MGKRCVVYGCSNTTKDGVSLHKFPQDRNVNAAWNKFIGHKRKDWKKNSESSTICSAHFAEDCFEDYSLAESFGLGRRFIFVTYLAMRNHEHI